MTMLSWWAVQKQCGPLPAGWMIVKTADLSWLLTQKRDARTVIENLTEHYTGAHGENPAMGAGRKLLAYWKELGYWKEKDNGK